MPSRGEANHSSPLCLRARAQLCSPDSDQRAKPKLNFLIWLLACDVDSRTLHVECGDQDVLLTVKSRALASPTYQIVSIKVWFSSLARTQLQSNIAQQCFRSLVNETASLSLLQKENAIKYIPQDVVDNKYNVIKMW